MIVIQIQLQKWNFTRQIAIRLLWVFASAAMMAEVSHAEPPQQTKRAKMIPHYFTVQDSIEMSRFDTTEGGPLFSPDNQWSTVVTSRGNLDTDSIESTLWIFRARKVARFLESKQETKPPVPKAVIRHAVVPRNNFEIPYAPVISQIRWQANSRMLFFLRQSPGGERHICRVDIQSNVVRELTPAGYDVSRYEVQGQTIVYLATPRNQTVQRGRAINRDVLDMTGQSLSALMPEIDETAYYREIWVIKNGTRLLLRNKKTGPIHLANHFPEVLSISPNGETVVLLLPSETVPASWEEYDPANGSARLRPSDPSVSDQFNFSRPLQYVVLDLRTGEVRFRLKALHAYALGYVQKDSAIWSREGNQLLLTNTFLPLGDANIRQEARPVKPCACALVNLATNSTTCVAWSRYTETSRSPILSAAFGKNGNTIALSFSTSPNGSIRDLYQRQGTNWHRVENTVIGDSGNDKSARTSPDTKRRIMLEIRETPNTPPSLFATDLGLGHSRKLWDPNPRLSSLNLGEVVSFDWVDSTGYKWTGQLVKPPDFVVSTRYPLVIQTYGFSGGFVADGLFPTASAVRSLAAAGIIVLQIPRRTDHYGTAQEATDQLLGFESAIEHLDQAGLIDPDKVGLVGFSRTCYHVLSALVNDPTRFSAATIADGMDGSFLQYLYSVGDPAASLDEQIYGTVPFGRGLQTWMDRAPGFNLDKVETPLRIETISFASAITEWETYASLLAQDKPVDLVYFPLGDHLLQKPLERLASQQGNVDWFRFWLKQEEDPDPAKRDQYALWRKLHQQLDIRKRASVTHEE